MSASLASSVSNLLTPPWLMSSENSMMRDDVLLPINDLGAAVRLHTPPQTTPSLVDNHRVLILIPVPTLLSSIRFGNWWWHNNAWLMQEMRSVRGSVVQLCCIAFENMGILWPRYYRPTMFLVAHVGLLDIGTMVEFLGLTLLENPDIGIFQSYQHDVS